MYQYTAVEDIRPTAALTWGRVRQQLSFSVVDRPRLSLGLPKGGVPDQHADVAIASLGRVWELLLEHKPKVAVDLDRWVPPPLDEVTTFYASGYPVDLRFEDAATAALPVLLNVELASTINSDTREFALLGSLAEPHGYCLGGIAGGPIIAAWRDRFTPIGLTFKVEPSSDDGPASWAGPKDILIRGLLLTPDRFDAWLQRLSS